MSLEPKVLGLTALSESPYKESETDSGVTTLSQKLRRKRKRTRSKSTTRKEERKVKVHKLVEEEIAATGTVMNYDNYCSILHLCTPHNSIL